MNTAFIYKFAEINPMTSVDRLIHLYHLLSHVLVFNVKGDVVEFGCHRGVTSAFFRIVMDYFCSKRELYVYDSFRGLPAPGPNDLVFREGECKVNSVDVLATFEAYGLRAPRVFEGWFKELPERALPERVAFAYLDSNFEESILSSLEKIYMRVQPGGVIVIDDYCDRSINPKAWDGLPGVKIAADSFFEDKPEKVSVLVGVDDLAMGFVRRLHD